MDDKFSLIDRNIQIGFKFLFNVSALSLTAIVSAGKAFSVAAPTIWNGLSAHTRSSPNIDCLKKSLKTELFGAAYPDFAP